ncbi:MAG: amino acid ABC transporter permease [Lachnospiraceae bacterium]|nr:amino acid ABC transporter permease [Lachnospiraceae bacterium]
MDFEVMGAYIPRFTEALWLTLRVGWLGILLAFFVGTITSAAQYFKIPVLRRIAGVYIEIFRNTPLLVQLFFFYYGLPAIGLNISEEVCGIIGIGLLGGSYMAESLRSGLESVPVSQTESALALGMGRAKLFVLIVLPQAFALSIPSLVANVIFLLKETSVFSAISLMDLMFTAKDLIGLYYDTSEALVLLVIFYMIMILPVSVAGRIFEKRMRGRIYGI